MFSKALEGFKADRTLELEHLKEQLDHVGDRGAPLQKRLFAAADREKEYLNILSWQRVIEAGEDIYQTRLKLREQRIFMPEDITTAFSEVIEKMSGAQVERRLMLENPQISSREFGNVSVEWLQNCVPTFETLAKVANERLCRKERR
jgi:hypothetical protein